MAQNEQDEADRLERSLTEIAVGHHLQTANLKKQIQSQQNENQSLKRAHHALLLRYEALLSQLQHILQQIPQTNPRKRPATQVAHTQIQTTSPVTRTSDPVRITNTTADVLGLTKEITYQCSPKQARTPAPKETRPPSSSDSALSQENTRPRVPVVLEVIRNRAERELLPAHYCVDCERFFDAAGYARDAPERQGIHEYCSRHRSKATHVDTPEGFWGFSL